MWAPGFFFAFLPASPSSNYFPDADRSSHIWRRTFCVVLNLFDAAMIFSDDWADIVFTDMISAIRRNLTLQIGDRAPFQGVDVAS